MVLFVEPQKTFKGSVYKINAIFPTQIMIYTQNALPMAESLNGNHIFRTDTHMTVHGLFTVAVFTKRFKIGVIIIRLVSILVMGIKQMSILGEVQSAAFTLPIPLFP